MYAQALRDAMMYCTVIWYMTTLVSELGVYGIAK